VNSNLDSENIELQESFENLLSLVIDIRETLRHLHNIDGFYSFDSNRLEELLEMLDEALDKYDL
jgi:hypothetical protein